MNVTSTKQGLELTGKLVYATVSDTEATAKKLLKRFKNQSITINCENLSKIDSAGIALLINWKRWCNNKKQMELVNVNKNAIALMKNYKLTEILGIAE